MFRSEDVSCFQIYFQKEQAKRIVSEFGYLGFVEFDDLKAEELDSQKTFFPQLQEITEQIKKLQLIKEYLQKNVQNYKEQNMSKETLKLVMDNLKIIQWKNEYKFYLEEKMKNFESCFSFIEQQQKDIKILQDKLIQSGDYINVLLYYQILLQDKVLLDNQYSLGSNSTIQSHFGVIPSVDFDNFQKQIFRMFRGNVILKQQNLITNHYHNVDQQLINKTVFFLTYLKSESDTITNKIMKLIQANNAQIFNIDLSQQSIDQLINSNLKNTSEFSQLFEKKKIDSENQMERYTNRNNVYKISQVELFEILILKQLLLFNNLNKLTLTNNYFEGRIWIPTKREQQLKVEINQLVQNQDFQGFKIIKLKFNPEQVKAPTYFELNTLTKPFQTITNTYSIPKYKEINPGVFNIITFPFLFGVMFGDVGHGFLLFVFALFLVYKKEKFPKMLTDLRYFILLSGFFSMYCGFIYNDFFALPLTIIKTCFSYQKHDQPKQECTYPLGIDYAWLLSKSKTQFTNSFKMKFSIIIGVFQMLVGIANKILNSIYFHDYQTLFCESIPQFVFLFLTFGYMGILIIVKWLTDYRGKESTAPSILNFFLNYVGENKNSLIVSDSFQKKLQQIFFFILIAICIPLIFLGKPLLHYFKDKKKEQTYKKIQETHDHSQLISLQNFEETAEAENFFEISHKEEEPFQEVMMHSLIEGIEFVLGTISNTASYLRLWALSLAHAQLSEVFFDLSLRSLINRQGNALLNGILICIIFFIFATVTFSVIMLMDQVECYLHTLRLHWVEFQSKFFKGDGRAFQVFSFLEEISEIIIKQNIIDLFYNIMFAKLAFFLFFKCMSQAKHQALQIKDISNNPGNLTNLLNYQKGAKKTQLLQQQANINLPQRQNLNIQINYQAELAINGITYKVVIKVDQANYTLYLYSNQQFQITRILSMPQNSCDLQTEQSLNKCNLYIYNNTATDPTFIKIIFTQRGKIIKCFKIDTTNINAVNLRPGQQNQLIQEISQIDINTIQWDWNSVTNNLILTQTPVDKINFQNNFVIHVKDNINITYLSKKLIFKIALNKLNELEILWFNDIDVAGVPNLLILDYNIDIYQLYFGFWIDGNSPFIFFKDKTKLIQFEQYNQDTTQKYKSSQKINISFIQQEITQMDYHFSEIETCTFNVNDLNSINLKMLFKTQQANDILPIQFTNSTILYEKIQTPHIPDNNLNQIYVDTKKLREQKQDIKLWNQIQLNNNNFKFNYLEASTYQFLNNPLLEISSNHQQGVQQIYKSKNFSFSNQILTIQNEYYKTNSFQINFKQFFDQNKYQSNFIVLSLVKEDIVVLQYGYTLFFFDILKTKLFQLTQENNNYISQQQLNNVVSIYLFLRSNENNSGQDAIQATKYWYNEIKKFKFFSQLDQYIYYIQWNNQEYRISKYDLKAQQLVYQTKLNFCEIIYMLNDDVVAGWMVNDDYIFFIETDVKIKLNNVKQVIKAQRLNRNSIVLLVHTQNQLQF